MKNSRLAQELEHEILEFIESKRSLMLAVNDTQGDPIASYAPFVVHQGCVCILVSALAHHTQALGHAKKASILIIDDEADCESVYARKRLQYDVAVESVARGSSDWQMIGAALLQRHGEIVAQLLQLGDFHMFKFSPLSGRFVKGFGRAYELAPNTLVSDQLDHIRG